MNDFLRLVLALFLAAGVAILVVDFVSDAFNTRRDRRREQFRRWLKKRRESPDPVDRAEAIAAARRLRVSDEDEFDYRGPWEREP